VKGSPNLTSNWTKDTIYTIISILNAKNTAK